MPVSTIKLDFPVSPRVRFGWGQPAHPQLADRIGQGNERYRETWRGLARFAPDFARIQTTTDDPLEPCWRNDWIPPLDGMSLYGLVAERNPRLFLEIGSGTSTKFVARAIRDHGLRTQILSIDPAPRSTIDPLCSRVVRAPLEEADLAVFSELKAGDILFCDNSHRAFQGSDATVFFTEVLPIIPADVLIGVHDIFLPHDYPADWLGRFYSEQYLLACWLLAGGLEVELPVHYCASEKPFADVIAPLFDGLPGLWRGGGAFWFRKKGIRQMIHTLDEAAVHPLAETIGRAVKTHVETTKSETAVHEALNALAGTTAWLLRSLPNPARSAARELFNESLADSLNDDAN